MDRAVSTVLDVAVCLLLVGAAAATLSGAVPDAGRAASADADPAAEELATVTAAVPTDDGRTAHDTVAGHLARGGVLAATLDGRRVLDTGYPGAVRETATDRSGDRVHVTARWEPYPDAPLTGTVEAGREPPRTADVSATRLTVDSGIEPPSAAGSFRRLAESLAEAYVSYLFPPERTRLRLVDARTAPAAADRYRAAGDAVGASVGGAIETADAAGANDRLAAALADRLAADLREAYGTPEAAAESVRIGRVEVVVRRWEP